MWEKEKNAGNHIFSFSPYKDKFQKLNVSVFIVCKCFEFGLVQTFVDW